MRVSQLRRISALTATVSNARIKQTVKGHAVYNNQHLFQHIDRQPNVVLVIHEREKPAPMTIFNKLCTMDVYVIEGVTFLELKMYETSDATEPQRVTTIVNPRSWEQIGQADPDNIK